MTDKSPAGAAHARRDEDILVITLDHPPVNALSADVRRDLAAGIQAAQSDAQVRAILLVGAGKTFIAGADIREFDAL